VEHRLRHVPTSEQERAINTRVLLVDDHQLMRQVLEIVVESDPDLSVVGTATCAESAFTVVDETSPDVVLMDLDMTGMDGISATRALALRHPLVRVVILSASCTRALVTDALAAGAWGYFVKEGSPHELLRGIHDVHRGQRALALSAQALVSP